MCADPCVTWLPRDQTDTQWREREAAVDGRRPDSPVERTGGWQPCRRVVGVVAAWFLTRGAGQLHIFSNLARICSEAGTPALTCLCVNYYSRWSNTGSTVFPYNALFQPLTETDFLSFLKSTWYVSFCVILKSMYLWVFFCNLNCSSLSTKGVKLFRKFSD